MSSWQQPRRIRPPRQLLRRRRLLRAPRQRLQLIQPPPIEKRKQGRPAQWRLRADAPAFLTAQEAAALTTADLRVRVRPIQLAHGVCRSGVRRTGMPFMLVPSAPALTCAHGLSQALWPQYYESDLPRSKTSNRAYLIKRLVEAGVAAVEHF
jgi:hypothetical protein